MLVRCWLFWAIIKQFKLNSITCLDSHKVIWWTIIITSNTIRLGRLITRGLCSKSWMSLFVLETHNMSRMSWFSWHSKRILENFFFLCIPRGFCNFKRIHQSGWHRYQQEKKEEISSTISLCGQRRMTHFWIGCRRNQAFLLTLQYNYNINGLRNSTILETSFQCMKSWIEEPLHCRCIEIRSHEIQENGFVLFTKSTVSFWAKVMPVTPQSLLNYLVSRSLHKFLLNW